MGQVGPRLSGGEEEDRPGGDLFAAPAVGVAEHRSGPLLGPRPQMPAWPGLDSLGQEGLVGLAHTSPWLCPAHWHLVCSIAGDV